MVKLFKEITKAQKAEITEHYIYAKLAKQEKDPENKKVLSKISQDEMKHYKIWEKITKIKMKPNLIKMYFYIFLSKIFGFSFALKLMEGGEENAQKFYLKVGKRYPEALIIMEDEQKHERELIRILKDNRLSYAGAIVLGLNDALVELTGTLAGLTLAFSNSTIIGITGLIMGIAAALSMAASGYLSSREEESDNDTSATISAIYTGVAYIITVIFLVGPYFIFKNIYTALSIMLLMTILIIAAYTFYISVAKEIKFKRRFLEMIMISLGVALISYGIGYLVRTYIGIEI